MAAITLGFAVAAASGMCVNAEAAANFSVTIDDLICSEEIITAAEDEKRACIDRYISLICCTLDILMAVLLFLPVFGNGAESPASVTLSEITGLRAWIRIVFAVLIGVTVLNGISGIIISRFDKPAWNRHRLVAGIVLSITGAAVFMMTRQPYAGILCLAMLVMKGLLIGKGKGLS